MTSFGYLVVDHRASPGLKEQDAINLGYHPSQVKEGALFEADTLRCCHCPAVYVKNPLRDRPRYSCAKCGNKYLCDGCAAAARQPDYVHKDFSEIIDDTINAAHRNEVLLNG